MSGGIVARTPARSKAARRRSVRSLARRSSSPKRSECCAPRAPDPPGCDDEGDRGAEAADDPLVADGPPELVGGLDAVLQRHDERPARKRGRHRAPGLLDLPRLHAEHDGVGARDRARIRRGARRMDADLALRHLHDQPLAPDRLEVRAARHEDDVLPRRRQPRAEVASCAARAVDDDPQPARLVLLPLPAPGGEGRGEDGSWVHWKSRGIVLSQLFSRTSLPFSRTRRVPW
jgi:hypothetical protein